MNRIYWLKNVRLECGYRKENERVTGTITGLFHLLMEDGRITKIIKDGEAIRDDLPVEDAKDCWRYHPSLKSMSILIRH